MAFTGRTIYNQGVFRGVAEDVSDMIAMISPYETPLLDALGDAANPASNVLHEWLEDELNPNTVVASTVVASTTAVSSVTVSYKGGPAAQYLQVGSVLKVNATGEYVQVTAIVGNDITFSRAFGGTTANSFAAGASLFLISEAAQEGADVEVDTSRPRSRKQNYCQIFKKDIIVSGTVQAVTNLGNVNDEYDYQRTQRMREILRDLEKAAIHGKTSGNTIGSSTAWRTMDGIWARLATNSFSVGATLSETMVNGVIKSAWDNGGNPDIIVCDALYKRQIDSFNTSRVQVIQGPTDSTFRNRVTYYEGTFGTQQVILCRWMPTNSFMALSRDKVHVVPLQGRSFFHESVARTGDAVKGMIVGEYTVEVMNEEGHAKAYG